MKGKKTAVIPALMTAVMRVMMMKAGLPSRRVIKLDSKLQNLYTNLAFVILYSRVDTLPVDSKLNVQTSKHMSQCTGTVVAFVIQYSRVDTLPVDSNEILINCTKQHVSQLNCYCSSSHWRLCT